MFKLPDRQPSLESKTQEWADFAEYNAWQSNYSKISLYELIKSPKLVLDESEVLGVEDETDEMDRISDQIAGEINHRKQICGDKYPFQLESNDYCILHATQNPLSDLIYRYLLMCTIVKMSQQRIQAGIDGALLFERLSAVIAKNFFGERSVVEVFGTGNKNGGGFRPRLTCLVNKMGEGGAIHLNRFYKPVDDKLDIVAWKGFSDRRSSKLIAFGQCKTGTSWIDSLSDLNPEAFCSRWFTDQLNHKPIKLFFCAQYFPRDTWRERAYDAGIVFDRFRIMDYLPQEIDSRLQEEIQQWTDAAFTSFNE